MLWGSQREEELTASVATLMEQLEAMVGSSQTHIATQGKRIEELEQQQYMEQERMVRVGLEQLN